MTDENPTPHRSPIASLFKGVQRLAFIAGAGLIVWILIGQQLNPPRPNPLPPKENTPPPAPPLSPEEVHAPPPPPPPPEPKPDASKEQLAHLEEQIATQQETLAALQQQIVDIQTKAAQQLSALTAFGQLKDALQRGESFTAPLAMLRSIAKEGDASALLDQLAPFAEKGIPTLSDVQHQFERTVPAALAPAQGSHALTQNLYSLIRIRKVGEQVGNDDEAVIARAELRLEQGDIAATLKEMSALSAPAAEAFAPWTIAAKNRVSALAAVDALQRALVADQ